MVGASDFEDLRCSVGLLVPGRAAYLEALARGSRTLCEYAQSATHEHNKELCGYLDGFLFRVESERHEGRLASAQWMLQLQSVFDRIRGFVVESERKSRLGALFSATQERAQGTSNGNGVQRTLATERGWKAHGHVLRFGLRN